MATVTNTITAALRLIGVQDANESADGPDATVAIDRLNKMMARWEADGIAVGWSAVSTVADTVPCPDEGLLAIEANLAMLLAPEYKVQTPPEVAAIASSGYAALLRDSFRMQPSDLSRVLGRGKPWNINSGP